MNRYGIWRRWFKCRVVEIELVNNMIIGFS